MSWTEAGPAQLWSVPVDGPGEWERLVVGEVGDIPSSWSPDGRRFLSSRRKGEVEPPTPITRLHVVHNWFAELERLAPTNQ